MLSAELQDALNEHLGRELYAAHLYLAMSAYAESLSLPGMAGWLRAQSREELEHAMRFYTFVFDRGGRVRLAGIDEPPAEFGSPLELFEQALQHERQVSEQIDKLYERSAEERDYATQAFLQEFVREQVEEERTASHIVETLRLVGQDRPALLMVDRELGQRGAAA